MNADANGPESADVFEMQRGMTRVALQKLEVFVSEFLDAGGKLV